MMKKRTFLLPCILLSWFSGQLLANLTTLQFWDPSPIYSGNNYLMPPNSQLVNQRKARKKDMKPDNKRNFCISFTGFAQAASRAYDWYGCNTYESYCGNSGQIGGQMGDFRGTLAAMPLFLGNDPKGNSIWDTNITLVSPETTTKSIFYDQTDTRLISQSAIDKTLLPPCLKNIASIFSGNVSPTGSSNSACPPNGNSQKDCDAFLFLPASVTSAQPFTTIPSVFSDDELSQDKTFFGAFSLPLEYRKYGLRIELAAEFCDFAGITIQTGFSNIQQTTTGLISMTNGLPAAYTQSTTAGQAQITNPVNLYTQLATNQIPPQGTSTNPVTEIENLFDDYISNNIDEILSPECGINLNTCNFDNISVEDIRFILSFKHTFDVDRYTAGDNDEYNWPDMLFTPYAWIGASAPVAKKQNYHKLLSLPFGNNGHASLGGAVGLTFDFIDSIEVGFEAGGTYFFAQNIYRPIPNHPLQRIAYPYSAAVKAQPGANGHFKALLNAYQFMNHISFWATYEIIQHRKDCYSMCNPSENFVTKSLTYNQTVTTPTPPPTTPSPDITTTCATPGNKIAVGTRTEQIFYPEILRCNSDWRMQFLNMALVFDIQPGMQASIVWQQPISPRNAYYPVSILGSFSFMF